MTIRTREARTGVNAVAGKTSRKSEKAANRTVLLSGGRHARLARVTHAASGRGQDGGWLLRRGPLGRAFVKVMSGAPNQCPRSAADMESAIRGGRRSSSYGPAPPAGAWRAHPLGQGIRGEL